MLMLPAGSPPAWQRPRRGELARGAAALPRRPRAAAPAVPNCCRRATGAAAPCAWPRPGACRGPAPASAAAAGAAASAGPQPQPRPLRRAVLFDFWDQQVPYEQAWAWQRRLVGAACGGGDGGGGAAPGGGGDAALLLQHPPTFTLGAGSTLAHLRFDPARPPHPLFRTERGGEVTYHGPGQLVLYLILDLSAHTRDLHWYLRSLEEVALRALDDVSGLEGERVDGLTGVWVGGAKLAAIGVRARKWVTFHGLALNVCPDLAPFGLIVPCGIEGRAVGSVESALAAGGGGGGEGGAAEGQGGAEHNGGGCGAAKRRELLLEYRYALLGALADVFGLDLAPAGPDDLAWLRAVDGGGGEGEGESEPAAAAAAARSALGLEAAAAADAGAVAAAV